MWNAILRWSLTQMDPATDPGEENSRAEPQEMSAERREFLTKAFDSLVIDETKRIKIVLSVLKTPLDAERLRGIADQLSTFEEYKVDSEHAQSMSNNALFLQMLHRKACALIELDELVLGLDNANDLVQDKLGGLPVLLAEMESPFFSLRYRVAQVISTVTQNNPKAQERVTAAGGIAILLTQLALTNANQPFPTLPADFSTASSTETETKETKNSREFFEDEDEDESELRTRERLALKTVTKSVFALSSVLRHNPAGIAQFEEQKGIQVLYSLLNTEGKFHANSTNKQLQKEQKRLVKKVVSLLRYFWRENSKYLNGSESVLVSLVTFIGDDNDIDMREQSLRALIELTAHNNNTVDTALRVESLGFREALLRRSKICGSYTDPEDLDMVRDEVELLRILIAKFGQATR